MSRFLFGQARRMWALLPCWLPVTALLSTSVMGQPTTTPPPLPKFQLTARPWQATSARRSDYLEAIEGICRCAAQFQDERGAIVDPILEREHQYSTPYYAFAVATLVEAGRAELLDSGVAAMEHATACLASGSRSIPDAHGEFFLVPLTRALQLLRPHVPAETWEKWQRRLRTPLARVMADFTGRLNNWRTYAMNGQWARAGAELVRRDEAVKFIESSWLSGTQRQRILHDRWNLYQDWSSDPQSHAVEAVGRGNLLSLTAHGYDGPSSKQIRDAVIRGTTTSLLLQDPTGQCPPNGRTDNHVFNDVLYGLCFETMARICRAEGDTYRAGQFRQAAALSLGSIARWKRGQPGWSGSYYITKNRFDPAQRVGYQPASQWGNYNGAVMMHLAEAYHACDDTLPQRPAPAEIGGYAFATDAGFSTFVANAGGMQVLCNLRGASVPKYGKSWTPLGVVRLSRSNWDSRLGPSDGHHSFAAGKAGAYQQSAMKFAQQYQARSGVSLAPTWIDRRQWVRMVDMHLHYRATPVVEFVHPLLVRFRLLYHYATGRGGPYFEQSFTVTPDGVYTTLTSPSGVACGLSIPLLEDDGQPLKTEIGRRSASTGYPGGGDTQHFMVLNANGRLERQEDRHRSTYGYLRPIRATLNQSETDSSQSLAGTAGVGERGVVGTADKENDEGAPLTLFIYPRSPSDPPAQQVLTSVRRTDAGFRSILHRVTQTTYVGRYAAGGFGNQLDLKGDGQADVRFDGTCNFVLQLRDDRVVAAESDRAVTMTIGERSVRLTPHEPWLAD